MDQRPKRVSQASTKLADPSNGTVPVFSSHQEAINRERARALEDARAKEQQLAEARATKARLTEKRTSALSQPSSSPTLPSQSATPTLSSSSTAVAQSESQSSIAEKRSASAASLTDNESADVVEIDASTPMAGRKRRRILTPLVDEIDEDGMLKDIEIIDVDAPSRVSNDVRCRDIKEFFDEPMEKTGDDGKVRKCRSCKPCQRKKVPQFLVNETSTLHRHLEAKHAGEYRTWAVKDNFESKLPGDVRDRKAKDAQLSQTQLDSHLQKMPPAERVVPYSDKVFREAAIEWLIATDQPISALEHPDFIKMINIAARATNGVKIPGRKVTRDEIIRLFKNQMDLLRQKLLSDTVKGNINLTCDAYQADTVDAYFATTGHWISEEKAREWKLEKALLGFARINNSHNGQRLGQTLFKITERLGITAKVGFITCDNAKNNGTMLREYGLHYTTKTKKPFDAKKRHIRCLAHVINLATQALITTHTKSKHFNPHDPEAHVPEMSSKIRDEVELIRAIAVKERSSAKRKELFRRVQERDGVTLPKQLILDMPVRWGSTYAMLHRAEMHKEFVNLFVYEMGREEKDLGKRQKIDKLELTDDEWTRAKVFLDLLAHADRAQQAFSSDNEPTLHLALPALEALNKAWSVRRNKSKYIQFRPALDAAIKKISEYYKHTDDSDAFIIAMLLDPVEKTKHFKNHWSAERQEKVLKRAEELFRERYYELYGDSTPSQSLKKGRTSKIKTLLRELSSDDEDDEVTDTAHGASPVDPTKPWLNKFQLYLETKESMADDISIVRWWGHNAHRYPVWASLARDYLSIMAASVSSEAAFSQAGITISKRRSRLGADIIEALQFLKCLLRRELFFRTAPSSADEAELNTDSATPADANADDIDEEEPWDQLLVDVDDDSDGCLDDSSLCDFD